MSLSTEQESLTARSWNSLVTSVINAWHNGRPADAEAVLGEHPGLRQHKSLAIDLAYEEYCLRRGRADELGKSAFCARFPDFTASLARQIELHELLEEKPQLLDDLVSSQWPEIGDELLGYEILDEIGRGGFARVYKARQPKVGDRDVVVKVTPYGTDEADTLGKLDHPNIVPIYSVHQDDDLGLCILCMPYLGRATLNDLLNLKKNPESVSEDDQTFFRSRFATEPSASKSAAQQNELARLKILAQMASGLCHAHDQEVFHLDLKPSNVLLTLGGDAMLLDFNLSFDKGKTPRRLGGTLPYMSPEQLRMFRDPKLSTDSLDGKSDVFALGVIGFELLYGTSPFIRHVNTEQSDDAIARELLVVQRLGTTLPGSPTETPNRILRKCVENDPEKRPSSRELLDLITCEIDRRTRTQTVPRWFVLTLSSAFVLAACASLIVLSVSRSEWIEGALVRSRRQAMRGDFIAAARILGRQVSKDSDFKTQMLLGYYCSLAGEPVEARHWYIEAMRQENASAALLNNIGCTYLATDDLIDAKEHFQLAAKADESFSAAWHNLALCEFKVARKSNVDAGAAVSHIRRVLRQSRNLEAMADAAVIYAYCGRLKADPTCAATALQLATECLSSGYPPSMLYSHPELAPFAQTSLPEAPTQVRPGKTLLEPLLVEVQ